MEQKINEENTENNLVFCIHPRRAFAIKWLPRSVFLNPSYKKKTCLFSNSVNPFPHNDAFCRLLETNLLKTLWEKETLLVTSNLSFSHSVFYPFG